MPPDSPTTERRPHSQARRPHKVLYFRTDERMHAFVLREAEARHQTVTELMSMTLAAFQREVEAVVERKREAGEL